MKRYFQLPHPIGVIAMITGGGGFIGVNLIEYLLQKDKSYNIICVDNDAKQDDHSLLKLSLFYPMLKCIDFLFSF